MLNNHGFSLLNVTLVLIALGLVGSLVLLNQTSSDSNRRLDETVKKMDVLINAIADYQAHHSTNAAPASLADLTSDASAIGACTADTASSRMINWCGPYIDNVFQEDTNDATTDGWGTAFYYDQASTTLRSWGPNKTDNAGGGDDITRTF